MSRTRWKSDIYTTAYRRSRPAAAGLALSKHARGPVSKSHRHHVGRLAAYPGHRYPPAWPALTLPCTLQLQVPPRAFVARARRPLCADQSSLSDDRESDTMSLSRGSSASYNSGGSVWEREQTRHQHHVELIESMVITGTNCVYYLL